jgi:hypothetical protein
MTAVVLNFPPVLSIESADVDGTASFCLMWIFFPHTRSASALLWRGTSVVAAHAEARAVAQECGGARILDRVQR